jgi:hypothetical protein
MFGVQSMAVVSASARRRSLALAWLAALALVAFSSQGRAQDEDLPGRVGRVADFAGQLFLSPEDRPDEWEAIGVNYPVTSGGNLWVSGDGRAEVDYGGGQFRLAGDTNVHVSRLDDRQLAVFVAQGRLIVRVRSLDPGDATRIDTPNTQVTLTRTGLYRIDVAPDRQSTTLIVREGEAEVALAGGVQQALPGQAVVVTGADASVASVRYAPATDGFDTWSANRDLRYDRARSASYVSRQMVGYADLDEYGSWQTYPEYGPVWFPAAVAPGWAPYQDGYWTDVGAWGPTWVDQAPWGYAPFHYGRWAYIGGRWGWCPGAYARRPVWAPALVAWYGGSSWGLAIGHGAPVYGWVPLGWREAYHPAWRQCSYNCWARYNRPYAVNVSVRPSAPPARYANLAVPGALSAVTASTLAGRAPVASNLLRVPAPLATSAPVLASAPPMAPRQRATPYPGMSRGAPPPAASTYAQTPRPEPANPRGSFRPSLPPDGANISPSNPDAARAPRHDARAREPATVPQTGQPSGKGPSPAPSPSASAIAPSRVASPPRAIPPISPVQPGVVGVAKPPVAVPKAPSMPPQVAPAANAPGPTAPAAPPSGRVGRAGGDKPAAESPQAGAPNVK